ncbi:hypothetical protein [Brachyspira hyodysenteriae]|uniref:hypothetical protein n=1 Tax=Brachyspira hyodysenteriae TaxID=159 RepID=UPI00063DB4CC|nr:hypothetical protein [Brachyspira hyodysenteriae]
MVSSEKGTILNYFGLANTYNPFTDENALQIVQDLDFNIPASEPFINSGYVAVSTGLLTNSLGFLNDCIFAIYDTDSTTKIIDLINVIGELGNDKYMPKENQIFWFNKDGLRGTYFLSNIYAGKKLRIVSGRYVTTSVTSGVLNYIFSLIGTSQGKKKIIYDTAGDYEFEFPSNPYVNSVIIKIFSGGAGGTAGVGRDVSIEPTNGGDSILKLGNIVIYTCGGGNIAKKDRTVYLSGGAQGTPIGNTGSPIVGQNGGFRQNLQIGGNPYGGSIINNMLNTNVGKGGAGSANGISAAGGGSGCGAEIEITREMMKQYGSNTIKITVGAGGKGGTNSQNFNGENGYDGAAIIEYYG